MSAAPALHVRRFGAGPVPVLGLHCALASGRALEGLAAHLPEATLTTFDMPGHGRSPDWPGGGGDYQGVCAAFAAGMLGREGSAHVIGHSFGATVALRLALSRS